MQIHPSKKIATLDKKTHTILDDVTIMIPTLGRSILEEALYWIGSGSAWPGALVVVDQGPNPAVEAWIEELRSIGINAEYLPSSQRGRAAGINRGLECVQTRFVAITDDDCFANYDWLETIVKRLRDNPGAIVTGRVEAAGKGVVLSVTSQIPTVYYRPQLKYDSMSGGNMGTSISVIKCVGLFDEAPYLATAEDAEWAYRALRAGIPIIYAPEIIVQHFGWRDKGGRITQYKNYALSHGGFYGKYLRKRDWFIGFRAVVHHGRAFRIWLRGTIIGDRELARLGWTYFTNLIPGIITGLREGKGP